MDNIFNFIFISKYNRIWLKRLYYILNSQKSVKEGAKVYNKEFSKFLIKNAIKWFAVGFVSAIGFVFVLLYLKPTYPLVIIGLIVAVIIFFAIRFQIVCRIED